MTTDLDDEAPGLDDVLPTPPRRSWELGPIDYRGEAVADIDALLAATPPEPPDSVTLVPSPPRCRHAWATTVHWDPEAGANVPTGTTHCLRCKRVRDPALSRAGRSNARLGKDQERRAERKYGWEKIGERGEKTDLRGRMFKVQQKSSRRPAPALVRDTFAGLSATVDGRIPLLLLTYVGQRGTDDYVLVRGSDWLDLHGLDEP